MAHGRALISPAEAFGIGIAGGVWPEARLEALRGTSIDWHGIYSRCADAFERGAMWRAAGWTEEALRAATASRPAPGHPVVVVTDRWHAARYEAGGAENLARMMAQHPGLAVTIQHVSGQPACGFVPG